ncbi:unnamed protein product [Rotaria sp. Silwood2]|nr:unnamed protein product [Rotaria sp. Silwood2]CAF2822060.1 unnamed protein product [Rotaria sp. Silwood2]CAF3852583.1 unnamed protein product [Rotaria sp. Silwood2]CAF4463071.1 unnamed protein product [Rotaria sp. Silwood2]
MSETTKELLNHLYEHSCGLHNENIHAELDCFVKQLDSDISRRYSSQASDKLSNQIEDCRKRAKATVQQYKLYLNEDLSHHQLELCFDSLMLDIDNIFTHMLSIFISMNEEIDVLRKQVSELVTETGCFKEKISNLEKRQISNDRQIFIRELFSHARTILIALLRKAKLPVCYVNAIYDTKIDIQHWNQTNSFLAHAIKMVANKFGLTVAELLGYLRSKRNSNSTFHCNNEMQDYARKHVTDRDYDLRKFLEEEELFVDLNVLELKTLQTVFEKVCQIYNDDSWFCIFSAEDNTQHLQINDHVKVIYEDGMLYNATLIRFDKKTNKYKIHYENRQYGYDWIIAERILKI